MPGKPHAPRRPPDRILTIDKAFVDRYPNANVLLADLREHIEETCAWATGEINQYAMRIIVWYDVDNIAECVAGMKPIGDALDDWDRHR